jgi:hypothetical protein
MSQSLKPVSCRKSIMPTCSPDKQARFWLQTYPAVENIRSLGTLVAGTIKYLMAFL